MSTKTIKLLHYKVIYAFEDLKVYIVPMYRRFVEFWLLTYHMCPVFGFRLELMTYG